ncbi:MAG: hypothetical protein JNK82_02715 [Myxococcaceae bacterium]|nr:hypothetical protein [Myxococcaceae bacterium]
MRPLLPFALAACAAVWAAELQVRSQARELSDEELRGMRTAESIPDLPIEIAPELTAQGLAHHLRRLRGAGLKPVWFVGQL